MQAHVQMEMRSFLGKPRKRGDVIGADELMQTTPQVISALVSQKLVILSGDGADRFGGVAGSGADAEKVSAMQAQIELLAEENRKLLARVDALDEFIDKHMAQGAKTTRR